MHDLQIATTCHIEMAGNVCYYVVQNYVSAQSIVNCQFALKLQTKIQQ
jgi:hypothetical protein